MVDEVFVNLPDDAPYPEMLLNQLTEMGAVVHMKLAKTSNLIGEKKFVERLGIYTVLTTSINYVTAKQLFMKRALDILGGLVGCLITLILTVILGPLIYIQSPGPIFFSQVRVGKNGKKFKIYKFRSMYMDAEERKKELMKQNRVKDGMMFKLEWDPRIIGTKKLPDGTIKKGIGNIIRGFFRNYPFLCFPTYLSFASNKRFLQRPYIVRFIIFNRLFVPQQSHYYSHRLRHFQSRLYLFLILQQNSLVL